MRHARVVACVTACLGLLAAACAKRVVPAIPEGESYVFPGAAEGEVSRDEAKALREAWSEILAGDAPAAARRCERLLARRPGLLPAETALAYARLRSGRTEEAAALFAAILDESPEYVPALVGAASAEFRRGDPDGALGLYRRAQAAAPQDALVRKRLAALKLQVTERRMALAEAALAAGDQAQAALEYRAALQAAPEVAGVRLALAELLLAGGDPAAAEAVLEEDPSGDRGVALRLAEVLSGEQHYARAAEVYEALLARDPADAGARAGLTSARESLALLSMPEEYRAIEQAPRVSRADLAALLAVRLPAARSPGEGESRVLVDISGSWAREHIAAVVALGIMDAYPNHTFQPEALVRRVDVARAAARVLDRWRWTRGTSPAPSDMAPTHLDYGAVGRVLAAGLMGLTAEGAFEPWRPVSGREAIEVLDALARLGGS